MTAAGPAFILSISKVGDREATEAPVADELAGRAAWLAAIADPAVRHAALVRPSGPHRTRYRCEWSTVGSFRDATDAHRTELVELCRRLSAEAPEGYVASILDDGRLVFDGPSDRRDRHNLGDLTCSTEARVRAHWRNYLPEGTAPAPGGVEAASPTP